ncbi:MAG: threonylcarbamoyl-AMP synthase [Solirubrobacteraceae bacterium]|nr:threonylcarbamoyl-AMP synthase [Solirubrobacteraceae bacterium]
MLTADDAATFERCMAAGGIALFPTDTVYGLACDADTAAAVERLYALKGRPPGKPSAVMLFSVDAALGVLEELPERARAAIEALLPGGVTLLLPNPRRRYPLACGDEPDTLGLRVPALPPAAAALQAVRWPILQTSANLAGEPEARRVADVDEAVRARVDLVLDGGELPGTPSTVVDLRAFAAGGEWSIVRLGMEPEAAIAGALAGL